jgi:hypothetical protein
VYEFIVTHKLKSYPLGNGAWRLGIVISGEIDFFTAYQWTISNTQYPMPSWREAGYSAHSPLPERFNDTQSSDWINH